MCVVESSCCTVELRDGLSHKSNPQIYFKRRHPPTLPPVPILYFCSTLFSLDHAAGSAQWPHWQEQAVSFFCWSERGCREWTEWNAYCRQSPKWIWASAWLDFCRTKWPLVHLIALFAAVSESNSLLLHFGLVPQACIPSLVHSIQNWSSSVSCLSFQQETSIIHDGSQLPQRVMFPLRQTYTSKLIHCSQYFKSHNNKGVTLRLMHSFAHTQTRTVHVGVWLSSYCLLWQRMKQKAEKMRANCSFKIGFGCEAHITGSIYIKALVTLPDKDAPCIREMLTTLSKVYHAGASMKNHSGVLGVHFNDCHTSFLSL